MTTALAAALALLRISENLAAGQPVSPKDADFFVAAIEEWLRGNNFTAAFGLKLAAGEADPRKIMANSWRDELIRRAARDFFEHLSPARRAEELHRAWMNYFKGAWQHDRKLTDCPARYAGNLESILFQISTLKLRALSERQIRRILATGPPVFMAEEKCSSVRVTTKRHTGGAVSFERNGGAHDPE
jgi:hypothetical protein